MLIVKDNSISDKKYEAFFHIVRISNICYINDSMDQIFTEIFPLLGNGMHL
jgi:hypothetical protein